MATIAELYLRVVASFRSLLFDLHAENCRVVRLEQVQASTFLEEFGRLQLWGDQSHANLEGQTRGSLDYILKDNDVLKDVVMGVLSQLQDMLDRAIPIAKKEFDTTRGSDQDSVSSVSTDSDLESSSSQGSPREQRKIPMIVFLASQIHDQIQCLYRLSITLRRPGFVVRYLRSTNKKTSWPLQHQFEAHDYDHVIEKVLQWKRLTKSTTTITSDEQPMSPGIEMLPSHIHKLPEDVQVLARRLAIANTQRREQLDYWTHHPDTPNRNGKGKDDKGKSTKSGSQSMDESSDGTLTQGSQLSRPPSGIAMSDLDNDTELGRSKTVYASSNIGSASSIRVPEVPREALSNEKFECPYCHREIDSGNMKTRQNWKRHVFRDLSPYVCTFPRCQNSEKLYETRHEWKYHEMQMHFRRWACQECGNIYGDRRGLEGHIGKHHSISMTDGQLQVRIDMSERPIDEPEVVRCPMCSHQPILLRALHDHLARHLEELALFVLPILSEEDGNTSEKSRSTTGTNSGRPNTLDKDLPKPQITTRMASEDLLSKSQTTTRMTSGDLSPRYQGDLSSQYQTATWANPGRLNTLDNEYQSASRTNSAPLHILGGGPRQVPPDPPGLLSTLITSQNSGISFDPRYQVSTAPRSFFKQGRVFSVLWQREAADKDHDNTTSASQAIYPTRFGENAHVYVRRMVVAKEYERSAWCFGIYTYAGRGVSTNSPHASKHAVVFAEGTQPVSGPGEPRMSKTPIEVRLVSRRQGLDPISRINFGRLFTVEHNVKVLPVGKVTERSMPVFLDYARQELLLP